MDRRITIEEIEGTQEADPGPDATFLIRRCLALRRKPLVDFTTQNLRIMLGQRIAVPILLPMALEVLANDPLAEGDYYPGDLLYNVLRLPEAAWNDAPSLRDGLVQALRTAPLPEQEIAGTGLRTAVVAFIDRSAPPGISMRAQAT